MAGLAAVVGNVPPGTFELDGRGRRHPRGLGAAFGAFRYFRRVYLFDFLEAMAALVALVFVQGQFKLLSFHVI